ncbi:MAG: tRNA isopentenyl-2-thiomethyl-A-37 hydroxylase MiaE [Deltaproteobacteria bacterium]|nr:tRNA isopentenyl-2-thiomethyl-A-37 hydroxylase MiaE [Deltaproteobacteria bacterium]
MLHLIGATSSAWLENALSSMDKILVDHAHCEHKAAVTALSFVSKYPDDPRLVTALGALARDEAGHFTRVAELCVAKGLSLGHPDKDPYVEALLACVRVGNVLDGRVDRLLCCALIEGRSCERLQLLAEALPKAAVVDDVVCALYADLWREEATHHTLFIELAERSLQRAGGKNPAERVRSRLAELAQKEGEILARLPVRAAIH